MTDTHFIKYGPGYVNEPHDQGLGRLAGLLGMQYNGCGLFLRFNIKFNAIIEGEPRTYTPDLFLSKTYDGNPILLFENDGEYHVARERQDKMRDNWFAERFNAPTVRFLVEELAWPADDDSEATADDGLTDAQVMDRIAYWVLFFTLRNRNPKRQEIV